MSASRHHEIQRLSKTRNETIQKLNSFILEEMRSRLNREMSKDEQDRIIRDFYLFLYLLIRSRSKLGAQMLTAKEIMPSDMLHPEQILKESLKDTAPALRDVEGRVFGGIFTKIDDSLKEFILDLSSSTFCIQIMNLDPDCQCLERMEFSKVMMLLDTNTLMALICPTRPEHVVARDFINLSRSLGTKLYFTKRTIDEYRQVLEKSNEIYKSLNVPPRLLGSIDDTFISSFSLELKMKPKQTWEGYYYRMRQLGGAIEKRFGIKIFGEEYNEILDYDYFQTLVEAVSSCYETLRGTAKKEEVAAHDAFHLILVRELRKKQEKTIFGPTSWFASLDYTLIWADKILDSFNPSNAPSTMNCDIWIQMITPFLGPDLRDKEAPRVFADLLASQFTVIPKRIKREDLKRIQGEWMNYDLLDEADLREILAEGFVKEYKKQVKKLIEEGEDIITAKKDFEFKLNLKLNQILNRKMQNLVSEVKNTKVESRAVERRLNEQMQSLREELETSRTRSKTLKSELSDEHKIKKTWRHASGILGTILLLANLLLLTSGQMELTIFSVPYFLGSSVVTAVLLMIAIAYEKVEVALRILLNIGKETK